MSNLSPVIAITVKEIGWTTDLRIICTKRVTQKEIQEPSIYTFTRNIPYTVYVCAKPNVCEVYSLILSTCKVEAQLSLKGCDKGCLEQSDALFPLSAS